jgi:hypothetical protein
MRRAIARGDVRPDPDGRVDTDELLRAGYKVKTELIPQEDDVTPEQSAGVRQTVKAPSAPGPATPAQAGLHASVSVHLEISGHQVDLTLSDADEGRLLKRLEAVLEQFPRAATPEGDRPPQRKLQEPIPYRISTLLRQNPSGLSRREIEQSLGITKNLSDTLVGMVRHKYLIRMGKGIYALPPD